MSAGEKAKAKTEQAKGAAKEATGKVLGNDRLVAEGEADKMAGDARETKEHTKDAFKDTFKR
ncbi:MULTISPECIES: CsbD family protein [Streptomyces]|uniref:CsbD family protein n=1 Tax=Streptomyces silvisoli TaxID=3034235 RepID=A0ABT5ZJ74_9ACTN|nr:MULTISPECIES: CsbD family protein [Streptomyces]MDF3289888.1 CsbD family protein [Streptomyces silvisoli]